MSRMIHQRHWDVILKMADYPNLEWGYSVGYLKYKIHMFMPYKSLVKMVIERNQGVGKNYEIKSHDLTLHSRVSVITWDMLKIGFEEWKKQVLTNNLKNIKQSEVIYD